MTYSKEQIRTALIGEWNHHQEDGYEDEFFETVNDYIAYLEELTYEQLVEETSTGEGFTLSEFINAYS